MEATNDLNAAEPQRSSSKTALGVAALRAVHQVLDGEPKILSDPIAGLLLDDEIRRAIGANPAQAREPEIVALRSRVVLRSRFAEDRMAEAVRHGVLQCVILGAGFDTFAYRQPEWASGLRIYEVDQHGTQEEKRRRLAKAGVVVPKNLDFVAIDFESVSLRDGLRASSLDFSRPTFFSCLGVFVYLTREAVDAVFRLVASFPHGSEIAFTYSPREAARSSLAERVISLGEPWRTYIEPDELARDLREFGFSEVFHLSTEEAERAYFKGRTDGLLAPLQGGIAAAVVGENAPS